MKITGHKIIKAEENKNDYSFFTDNGAELIISYISEKTIRMAVRFHKAEEFDKSYAIEEIHYENTDSLLEDSGSLVYYLFVGDSFGDILNEYTNLTGKPSLPLLWALGYIQCKCSYWCWDEIDKIIDTIQKSASPTLTFYMRRRNISSKFMSMQSLSRLYVEIPRWQSTAIKIF